jgi:hypothetical protein
MYDPLASQSQSQCVLEAGLREADGLMDAQSHKDFEYMHLPAPSIVRAK